MKITWGIILFFFSITTSKAQTETTYMGIKMDFENEHIDLGEVKRGEKVTFDYVFYNKGTEVLEIEIVSGCECTTLDWPRSKINPGAKAVINVIFDSTEKDKSETIEVDITLKNIDPNTNAQYFKILTYSYELIK